MEINKMVYNLNANDYVNVNRIMTLRKMISKIMLFFAIPAVAIFNLFLVVTTGNLTGIVAIFSFMMMYAAIFVIAPSSIKKSYDNNEQLKKEIEVAMDDKSFSIVQGDTNENFSWSDFHGIHETDDYLLLILKSNKNSAKVLPKRVFSDATQLEEVSSFIKLKIN